MHGMPHEAEPHAEITDFEVALELIDELDSRSPSTSKTPGSQETTGSRERRYLAALAGPTARKRQGFENARWRPMGDGGSQS